MLKMTTQLIGSVALTICALAQPALAAQTPSYEVVKTVPLGPPDAYDYVTYDALSGRVYIGHGTEVAVVDGHSGAMLGKVSGMGIDAAQGVASVPSLGLGFVASGGTGDLVSFDLKTLKPVAKVATADDADLVLLDPGSNRLFVVNGHSKSISVVDPATMKVESTITLDASTQGGLVDAGKLYVNVGGKGEIDRIDLAGLKVDAHWTLPGCSNPRGLGYDSAGKRLFAACTTGRMIVLDSTDGHTVADLPIGKVSDGGGFDPVHKRAFSSNSEGTLSVVSDENPAKPEALGSVKTAPGARTMAVDPATGRVFLVTADVSDTKAAAGGAPSFDFKPSTVHLMMLDPK